MPRLSRSWLFLLREMVRRDFRARYAGSLLGLLWSFVQPLWQLLLFTFVFSTVLRISPLGARTGSFAVFLFCGLLPWMAVQEGILRGTTAVTDNAQLVTKVRLPAAVLVLTVVGSALLHEAVAAAVFAVVLLVTGELSPATLSLLGVALPLQLALTAGVALPLAALNAYFRDTVQLVGMALTGWFYLTPIVYPLPLVPERYREWLLWNPLTPLVELYRAAFLGGALADVEGLGLLAATAGLGCAGGWWVFRKLAPGFADLL